MDVTVFHISIYIIYIYIEYNIIIYIFFGVRNITYTTVPHTHQHICRLDVHLEQVEDCKKF